MKKAYIISIIMIFTILVSSKKRVLHLGVDGVLQKCINQSKHTIFDFFEKNGSYSYSSRTAIQTMSAPSWSNILCGVDTEMSGITSNDWRAPWIYGPQPITPYTGDDKPIPCIFEQIKKEKSELKTAYLYDWDWFNNFNKYSIQNSIDYDFYCDTDTVEDYIKCDTVNFNNLRDIIKGKDNMDFDYMFYYIGQVDEQGHSSGFCSDKYIERLTVVNDIIESIVSLLKESGKFDDTYIIWNTDHGANYLTRGHGYQNDDNLLVRSYIMGPNIKKSYKIQGEIKNLDIPATVCKILEINPYDEWKSRPIEEIFDNLNNDLLSMKFLS